MTFLARRKPITLFICCGLTNALVAGLPADAAAQSASPLLVDPALLGPAPGKPAAGARTEVKAVAAPAVESRPVPVAIEEKKTPPEPEARRAAPAAPMPAAAPPVSAAAMAAPAATPVAPPLAAAPEPAAPLPAPAPASAPRPAEAAPPAREANKSWFRRFWDPVADAYDYGDWEFYLPLRTHHLRGKYAADKIANYQESPLGFGLGKGYYNEHGNWEGVYAMAFQDSHFKPMYTAGYGWKAIWRPAEDVRLGAGYIAGLMSRTDIGGYIPFPFIFPTASLAYKNLSLETTFVPGGRGYGNIFFIWSKWEFGKSGERLGTPSRPRLAPAAPTAAVDFPTRTWAESRRVPYGPTVETGGAPGDGGPGTAASAAAPSAASASSVAPGDAGGMMSAPADETPPLALSAAKKMTPPPKESREPRPVFLSALRMGGQTEREFNAEGEVELRKVGTVLNSDWLTYWPIEDEVEAEGNVRLQQNEDVVTGPKMRLKLQEQVGFFEEPVYRLKRQPANPPGVRPQAPGGYWTSGFASPHALDLAPASRVATEGRGQAERIDFEGENQVRVTKGTYTTCPPGNDDWYAQTRDLALDFDREVGEGRDGLLYFKGVPLFYTPWLSFPLNNARKSGLLAPSIGMSNLNGFEYVQPYYLNIAPNMDATFRPRLMTRRGMQLTNEFRYLNTAFGGLYQGEARAEILPNDRLRNGLNRWGVSLNHQQATASGFTGSINYHQVSDDNYYTDLSSGVATTSQTQLLQQGMLSYGGGWWNATANFQSYQTLQPDPSNPVREPYRLLPQLSVNARRPDLYGLDAIFSGQMTHFTRRDQVINTVNLPGDSALRTVLYPQIAFPYINPGWYVTPKIGLNYRRYSISGQPADVPRTQSVTLPILSVGAGMTFERDSRWFGRDYTQTLEPRLYYLYVPYKDQQQIPLYDTGLADFNFAQIFSENQFSSWDRINNANQLTAAATTRLIEPETGNEIARAMLGQRFHFSQNRVGLTAAPATAAGDRKWARSDTLAAFSGQVLPRLYANLALQYNFADRKAARYSLGGRYQPEPGKVINAEYRFNRDPSSPIDQFDVSGQWPLTGRLSAVGRVNYSFKDDGVNLSTQYARGRIVESVAGLEYNGGCWVLRGVVSRSALTQDTQSTAFFLQLELNDFSQIGSNPLDLLKRSVQGYSPLNDPGGASDFGD